VEPLEYPVGARVRLAQSFDGCACGAVGTVVGFYRTDPPSYAVRFEEISVRVSPEYLVAVDESG
jgi:hypothetical protein